VADVWRLSRRIKDRSYDRYKIASSRKDKSANARAPLRMQSNARARAHAFVNGWQTVSTWKLAELVFGRNINPHYQRASPDVAQACVVRFLSFSLRRATIADADHQFARRRRGANCRRARCTRRRSYSEHSEARRRR